MNDSYFKNMQKANKAHLRTLDKSSERVNNPLFTRGECEAYKLWSIARIYEQDDIITNQLPADEDLPDFVDTFREAEVRSLVLYGDAATEADKLTYLGCGIGEECRKDILLDPRFLVKNPETVSIKGIRIYL